MSAATAAAELGLAVVVFDQQAAPGGQIYRGLERLAAETPAPRRGAGCRLRRRRRTGARLSRQRRRLPAAIDGLADRRVEGVCALPERRGRGRGAEHPHRYRRRRARNPVSGVDPARRDDLRRRPDPAQERLRGAGRARGAGRFGAAAVHAGLAAPYRRRPGGQDPGNHQPSQLRPHAGAVVERFAPPKISTPWFLAAGRFARRRDCDRRRCQRPAGARR